MSLRVLAEPLPGVLLLHAPRHADERGWFTEAWNSARYREVGLDAVLVQHNVSFSRQGVLRGLHFQWPHPQGKLITVLSGCIYDVIADVRPGSPDFGRWYGCELSAENAQQLWVPPGYAHGFLVRSATALVQYGCSAHYHSRSDRVLAWNDPDVKIAWPEAPTSISEKDRAGASLAELRARGALPPYQPASPGP